MKYPCWKSLAILEICENRPPPPDKIFLCSFNSLEVPKQYKLCVRFWHHFRIERSVCVVQTFTIVLIHIIHESPSRPHLDTYVLLFAKSSSASLYLIIVAFWIQFSGVKDDRSSFRTCEDWIPLFLHLSPPTGWFAPYFFKVSADHRNVLLIDLFAWSRLKSTFGLYIYKLDCQIPRYHAGC